MHINLEEARWFTHKGKGGKITKTEKLLHLSNSNTTIVSALVEFDKVQDSEKLSDISTRYFLWLTEDNNETVDILETPKAASALLESGLAAKAEVQALAPNSSNSLFFSEDRVLKVFRRPGGEREVTSLQATAELSCTPVLLEVLQTDSVLGMATQLIEAPSAWEAGKRLRRLPLTEIIEALAQVHQALIKLGEFSVSGSEIANSGLNQLAYAQKITPDLDLSPLAEFYQPLFDQEYLAQIIHGDFHLGQVLLANQGPMIIDFEGVPGQDPNRHLPVEYDLASLIRSLDYYSFERFDSMISVEDARNIISKYREYYPKLNQELLNAMLIDRVIHEMIYESLTRPDWVHIPKRAINSLLQQEEPWHSILQVD